MEQVDWECFERQTVNKNCGRSIHIRKDQEDRAWCNARVLTGNSPLFKYDYTMKPLMCRRCMEAIRGQNLIRKGHSRLNAIWRISGE